VVPCDRTRGNGHELNHRSSCLNNKKQLIIVRATEPMAQAAQRSCGASILEDTQNLTGHGPALADRG